MPFDEDAEDAAADEEEEEEGNYQESSNPDGSAGFQNFARRPRSQRARHHRALINTYDASSDGAELLLQDLLLRRVLLGMQLPCVGSNLE